MLYAFDLDGTLIDSHDTVLESYMDVGVTPPPDFFTRSWHEWLKDPELHRRKNALYLQKIPLIKPLPLMELFKLLGKDASIMTGASREACAAIAKHFNLNLRQIHWELSVDSKIWVMNRALIPGIMFEDQRVAAERMRRETCWTVCHTM